jgi:3-deoxy-D-manno-octulosonic-acid transferase
VALTLYRLLLRLALPFVVLRQWWRHRGEAGQRADWREFFGRYSDRSLASVIWLHAASVRGTHAAGLLARALRAAYPDHDVLVTSSTPTGRDAMLQACDGEVMSAYVPYDLPGGARRFLAHFRPKVGVVVGVEVWPSLLAACRRLGVPMVLANARLSQDLARSYARFGALSRPAFGTFAACCAQDRASAQRLRRLGALRVILTGNIDFDAPSNPSQVEEGRALMAALRGRNTILLAGICESEEEMLFDALAQDDGTLIVVVPRRAERCDAVAALAAVRGMSVARRSRGEAPHIGRRVFLGDTTGEMPFYYAMSTVAVIGGSFSPAGNGNLLGACAAGIPSIIGPHISGDAGFARPAVAAGAAIMVADAREAVRTARRLLEIREWRERMALAGLKLGTAHKGATARHLQVCRRLLSGTKPGPG